jgi:hypothetical protein
MVFQQRNGRIDRYGQNRTPQIVYLVTRSDVPKIRGDMRILELLIEKDNETVKNIGDPAEFMGVHDIAEEERLTASAIEKGQTPEAFEAAVRADGNDPMSILFGEEAPPVGEAAEASCFSMPSLFRDDYAYVEKAVQFLARSGTLQARFYPDERRIDLAVNGELKSRFRFLPGEIWPDGGSFILSANRQAIQAEIHRSRKDEKAWPGVHYLWELNPVVDWINDKLHAAFGRHEAPVIILPGTLASRETVFLMSGLIPNRKSHPLVHRWFGVCFEDGRISCVEPFEKIIQKTGLGKGTIPNAEGEIDLDPLKALMPEALRAAVDWMRRRRKEFEDAVNDKLNAQLEALERLRKKQHVQIELQFEESRQHEKTILSRKEKQRRAVDQLFDSYLEWIQDTMTTEDHPYIQIISVLKG